MASDWNEELDKYESGRSFGDDLRDSIRTACSAASVIISRLPDSNSVEAQEKYKSSLKYSWEKEGFFRKKDGFN